MPPMTEKISHIMAGLMLAGFSQLAASVGLPTSSEELTKLYAEDQRDR
jgi:hypothetical protein